MTPDTLKNAIQQALTSGPQPLTVGRQADPNGPPLEVTIVVHTRDQAEEGICLATQLYNGRTCSRHSDRIHFVVQPDGHLGEILNGLIQ